MFSPYLDSSFLRFVADEVQASRNLLQRLTDQSRQIEHQLLQARRALDLTWWPSQRASSESALVASSQPGERSPVGMFGAPTERDRWVMSFVAEMASRDLPQSEQLIADMARDIYPSMGHLPAVQASHVAYVHLKIPTAVPASPADAPEATDDSA